MREKFISVFSKNLNYFEGKINSKRKNNKASITWAYRFLKRRGFNIRRISHIGQTVPREKNQINHDLFLKL